MVTLEKQIIAFASKEFAGGPAEKAAAPTKKTALLSFNLHTLKEIEQEIHYDIQAEWLQSYPKLGEALQELAWRDERRSDFQVKGWKYKV